MTQATFDRWSKRERLSNKPLDCTFVYGNSRVVYNMGGQYSGSPWHAPGYNTPTGSICDYLLSFPEDDPLLGETEATLQVPGNGGGDNSYQREQTAYWIGEQIGLPYCYRRLVHLFVNGTRRAQFYEDVQQPNGDMMDEFYPEGKNGDLHKIMIWFEFDDRASTFEAIGASLQKFTTTGGQKKLPRYRWTFGKRAVHGSASNYTNLFKLVDAAAFTGLGVNYRRQLETTIDVDNWLKTYAVEHVVGNNDSFAYGGGQNMYTYKPAGDTWKMLIWDIDFAFAVQGPTSDVYQGIGRGNGIDLGEPEYRRRYMQILRDIATGPLQLARIGPLLDAKHSAMTASGRSVENPSSIKNFVNSRRNHLMNQLSNNAASPFTLTLNGGAGFTTDWNQVSLAGTAPITVRAITVNGRPCPVTWSAILKWTAPLVLGPGTNTLKVEGWDAAGNLVTGATATMTITNTAPAELPEDLVVINEIQYDPAEPATAFIELHNLSSRTAFDLSGWRLQGVDFEFPAGSIITPGGFLVVAADKLAFAAAYSPLVPLAGEFRGNLANSGELLRLLQPGPTPGEETVVDEVRYGTEPPWPPGARGTGASLQLMDPAQDNRRPGNWAVAPPGSAKLATPGAMNSVYSSLPPFPAIWLNEILPDNRNGAGDRFGHRHPWVELFNAGSTSVSLDGLFLANSYTNLARWRFPGGLTIPAGGFRTVWLDGNPAESTPAEQHANFKIPAGSGSLALVTTNGGAPLVLDYLDYTVSRPDVSFGSYPDGAPYERRPFSSPTPGATNNPAWSPVHVLINEWMADNQGALADPADNQFEDWFELYNPEDTAADLSGLFLGTSLADRTKFPLPPGYTVPPGGYLLVWADGENSQNATNRADLHTNFKLSKAGDAIGLFAADGTVIDFVPFGPQEPDVSEGRFPDGTDGAAFFARPTPRSRNFLDTWNGPPAIDPISDAVVIEGQLLQLRVRAADTNLPPQLLSFSLEPGAPPGASIHPETGLFTWQSAVGQAPGYFWITVKATDNGTPTLSARARFIVQVAPRPQVSSVAALAGGGVSLVFATVPGKTYRVDYKETLLDSVWRALGPAKAATSDSMRIADPAAGSGQRFYRIAVLD
jgi:hypothetical protein